MIQEKQLKELIKWLETEKDLAVTEADKTQIRKLLGVESDLNPIAKAYHNYEPIRYKKWAKHCWIKKHSYTNAIDEKGLTRNSLLYPFHTNPELWEIYEEPKQAKPFDKDRFEAMFRAVVASGRNETWEQDLKSTEIAIAKLDAYYASKKGGSNG